MADLKISQLTGASTPLAGTEVLPIVQSGSTVKVSVANLTAGRAVATAGGSFTDNITQSTAAKGVNFTANTPAAGMTSQLLNWYEEGTFTPDVYGTSTRGAATYAANGQVGLYTRIGNVVYITVWLSWTAHTGTGSLRVDGLPFTSKSTTSSFAFLACYNDGLSLAANSYMMAYISPGTQILVPQQVVTGGGSSGSIGMDTAATMGFTGMYFV